MRVWGVGGRSYRVPQPALGLPAVQEADGQLGLRPRAVGFSQDRTEDCLGPCCSFIPSSLVLGFLERSLLRIHFLPKFRVVFAAAKNPDKYLPIPHWEAIKPDFFQCSIPSKMVYHTEKTLENIVDLTVAFKIRHLWLTVLTLSLTHIVSSHFISKKKIHTYQSAKVRTKYSKVFPYQSPQHLLPIRVSWGSFKMSSRPGPTPDQLNQSPWYGGAGISILKFLRWS